MGDTSGIGGVSRVGAGATQAFGGTPGTSDDLPSSPQLTGSFAENEVTEATVAAVAAAASAAAAAAAAAVVAAAGQQVQAHLQVRSLDSGNAMHLFLQAAAHAWLRALFRCIPRKASLFSACRHLCWRS